MIPGECQAPATLAGRGTAPPLAGRDDVPGASVVPARLRRGVCATDSLVAPFMARRVSAAPAGPALPLAVRDDVRGARVNAAMSQASLPPARRCVGAADPLVTFRGAARARRRRCLRCPRAVPSFLVMIMMLKFWLAAARSPPAPDSGLPYSSLITSIYRHH